MARTKRIAFKLHPEQYARLGALRSRLPGPSEEEELTLLEAFDWAMEAAEWREHNPNEGKKLCDALKDASFDYSKHDTGGL